MNQAEPQKMNIGIIFGGASSEYEVSLMSASSVLKNINYDLYNVYRIGITKDGKMLLHNGNIETIANNTWVGDSCSPCVISCDRSHHGILVFDSENKATVIRLDAVFPVLHGKNGEDGTMQGLLSISGIPFVGCDTLSSACCMDKDVTHALLDSANIPISSWLTTTFHIYKKNKSTFFDEVESVLGYPCFVKPANSGSSVGITKAKDRNSLEEACERAFIHDKKIIVEEMLIGTELECAVLGNNQPIASCVGEIAACNEFYDYDAKYLAGKTQTFVPARISESDSTAIRTTAIKAYRTMGCAGLARIDFFLTQSGKVILNELNTIPGFTSISMYPALFIESGIPYSELITKLIEYAINVAQNEKACSDWNK